MENNNPIEFEGVTSKTYGLNVELPKNMSEYGYDDYMFHLNRGITKEERQQYFDTNIPYNVGLSIAARSKNKKPDVADKEENTLVNNVTDAFKGAYNTLFELPASLGGSIDDTVTGLMNEYLYDDPEQARQATLRNQQIRNSLKDEFTLDTKGTFWGQGIGSIGASTAIGVVTKANPLVMTLFGTMNYEENLQKMLEGGASFKEASSRAFFGGLLEAASEKFGFQVASKYVQGLLRKYAARFGIEGFQEFWQEIKDQFIVGKYDTRSDEDMAKAAFTAMFFGGLGGALGFAINDVSTRRARKNVTKIAEEKGYTPEESKEIGLSVLDEQGEQYRKEVQKKRNERIKEALTESRANVYNALVKQGNDPAIAAQKAEVIVPDLEVMENEIEQIVSQGFKETELEKLKKDYDEAIRIGGDKAVVYMKLRDRVRELAKEAGFSEEESEGQEKILTSLFAQWYDKSDMSVDDFWDFLETRLELKDVINEPIVGEGMITQDQLDNEVMRREQLETAMNLGKKGGRLFSFVGEKANLPKKTRTSLDEAKSLEQDGLLNNEQIRQTTSWSKGIDGKWKLEISDKDAKINIENITKQGLKLGDILSHDILYGAYPKLKDIPVVYNPNMSAIASVRKRYSEIVLGRKFKNDSDTEQRKTIMHEVQHLIQGKEGFAVGGSTGNFRSPKTTSSEKLDLWRRNLIAETLLDSLDLKSTAPVSTARRLMSEIKEKAKHSEFLQDRIKKFEELEEQFKEYDQNTSYAKYRKLGGELEANMTAERIDLTDEERRKTPIEYPDDAIIKFDDGVTVPYKYTTSYDPKITNKVTYKGKPIKPYGKGVKGEIATQLAMGKTPNEIGLRAQESINYAKDELARLEPEIAVAKSKISEEVAKDIEDEVNERYGKDFYTTRENPNEQEYLDLVDSKKEYQDIIDFNTKIMNFNFDDFNVKGNRLFSRTDRIQGAFDRVNNIVEIAKEHNPDVFLHEMSHVFFTNYMPWLEESGRSQEAKAIYKLVGKNNINEFDDNDWEKITEVFLQYVRTGDAPNMIMERTFEKAKDWLITQFRTISEDYEVSDEIKDFFDTLIADESDISELANVKTRIRDIENSIKQHLDNQEVTFKGQSASDIKALKRAFHTRRPRAGTSLTEHLRKAGGIEPDSALGKQLGYDSKKKQRVFKKGGLESMDSLLEFLVDEGYIPTMDYDTYEQRSAIEDEVENLINNSDYVFNEENSLLNEARDNVYNLQGEVAGVYDDIMKDLGIKDYDELEKILSEIARDMTEQKKDIAKLNKDAIKYIQTSMNKAKRKLQKTEKDVEALKQKYADKLQKAKDKAEADKQKLKDQQKDKVKEIRQMQKIIDENQFVLQQELTDKIRGLPINYAHQNDLLKNVAKVKDLNSYNRIVESVMQKAEEYADKEMKWLLRNSIDKMLKGTKQKAGENKKYTYEGGKLFNELRSIQNLTQTEAQNELDDRLEKAFEKDSEGIEASVLWGESEKLINRMLKYRASGMKASTEELYNLALDLNEIIKNDIKERSDFEKLKSAKRQEMREEMANSLEKLKKGTATERAFSQYLGDWHTINNELFGKKIADELNMLYEASNQTNYYSERRNFEEESAILAYGLKDKYEWLDKYEELKQPRYEIQRNDKRFPDKISKADLMDLYLQMQNPETRELIMRNYETMSEEGVNLTQQIPALLENLTEQDKLFASLLAKQLQNDYDIENKAYIRRTGVDMPQIEGYFPRTSDYGTDIDTDYRNVALAIPSYYKMRSSNAIPVFRDAIQKYREHIMEASYAVEMFDKYKEIYLTIMNSGSGDNKINVKDLIEQKYGKDDLREYLKYLKSLSPATYDNKVGKAEKILGKLVNNWIAKNIGLNAQVYAKQLISIINYSENMPYDEYFKNLSYALAHPKEAKALVEKYVGREIKSRFERGLQNETVASVLNPDKPDRILPIGLDAKLKDLASFFVRKGDITPIIFGGYARIKYLEEQGKSKEEIKKIFVEETNRSQQSSLSPSLSLYQKNTNLVSRILLAFKNTALQYTRLTMEAVTQYRRGEISEKQFAKTIFTYMVAGRLMYEISSNLLKGLAGLALDDDKKKKESTPSIAQWLSFPIRFFTDSVPIIDTFVNNIVRKAGGGAVYSSGIGISDDLWRVYQKLNKKGADLNDYVDGGLLASDLFTGWGLSTAKRQFGYFVPDKKKKL